MPLRSDQHVPADVEVIPASPQHLAAPKQPQELEGGIGDARRASFPVSHRALGHAEQLGAGNDAETGGEAGLTEAGTIDRKDLPFGSVRMADDPVGHFA